VSWGLGNGQSWPCMWCQASQDGYRIRHDPAEATVGDLAADVARDGFPSLPEPARTLGYLPNAIYLGGYLPHEQLTVRGQYSVAFLHDRLSVLDLHSARPVVELRYPDVQDVEIGGPGVIKTGGGFVGGGIGLAGAAEGIAIAAALNALTRRTTIRTVLRIQARNAELFLLNTDTEPGVLRIGLSRALGALREARSTVANLAEDPTTGPGAASAVNELSRLASLLDQGLVTREEFELLKAKLIGGL
jgi:hypothetical protein